MDIITGYLGEPHVTSEQDRDINIGIVGDGSYVMPTGQRIAAEVSNNNEIRIRDGLIIHQGCAASIKKNTYDSVNIINGSQGMKRIDLIVARYQREAETDKETISLVVIQGTPAESDPVVPEHTEGDIQAGDSVADMPLYQVTIDGLNITEVKKVFEEITSLKELNSKIKTRYDWTNKIAVANNQDYTAPDDGIIVGIASMSSGNWNIYVLNRSFSVQRPFSAISGSGDNQYASVWCPCCKGDVVRYYTNHFAAYEGYFVPLI